MYGRISTCAVAMVALLVAPSERLHAQAVPEPTPLTTGEIPWRIVDAESVFAVVTKKEGFAARLAHNHLVVARDYLVRLSLNPDRLDRTVFDLEAVAPSLVVDDPAERERWEPRIAALGIVDELGAPDEGQRAEIREKMLSDDQLDAETDPRISVTLIGARAGERVEGEVTFPYTAEIAIRVRGTTVTREVAADFRIEGERIHVEAVGHFTFEEFGIEPYSAFLGSVKNSNDFVVYLNLQGVR